MKLNWTDDRVEELEDLGTLLREAAAINHGSNCLERIQRVIALADALNREDFPRGCESLHSFLRRLAIADRTSGPADAAAAERERLRVMLVRHRDQIRINHHVTLAEFHTARNALQLVLDEWYPTTVKRELT
ncbi:MAG: hypothetical protein ACK5ZS_01540 [bacterium]|jgi:hypothetical protein